jgi:peptide/nickel transport system permease protein
MNGRSFQRWALARLVLNRLAQGLVVLIGALLVCFALSAATGDPADALSVGQIGADNAQIEALRNHLGYGDPFLTRLGSFLANAVHGDFGSSYRTGESALGTVLAALPYTLLLVGCALLFAIVIAVVLSIVSVMHRNGLPDRAIRGSLGLAQGIPDFWLAIMMVLIFSVSLGWFPSLGFDGPRSLVLPVLALGIPVVPTFVRLMRGSLLDVMKLDFITSVRAKGLTERDVVLRHAVPNALPPLIAFTALQIGWLIGGTIIVETIFAWPGIGNLVVEAVKARDVAVVQASVAVIAACYVLLNLAADLLVAAADPRIRMVPA